VWNIGRLLLGHLEAGAPALSAIDPATLTLADRWILSRARETIRITTQHNERFRLNEAAGAVYHFLWSDLADWYLEQVKPRLYGTQPGGEVARSVAAHVFDIALRLLHPVMPYITETLWQRLPNRDGAESISIAAWPTTADAAADTVAETDFAAVQAIITGVRVVRAKYNVPPGQGVHVTVTNPSALVTRAMQAENETIRRLAKVDQLETGATVSDTSVTYVLDDGTVISVPLGDLVDLEQECRRLGTEADKLDKLVAAQEKKLGNEQFVSRAPAAVIDKEREKLASWRAQSESLRDKRRSIGCAD